MKLKPDHIKYLQALRPAHWDQLVCYIEDAQSSGAYWGNEKQHKARATTLQAVFVIIARNQRKRAKA